MSRKRGAARGGRRAGARPGPAGAARRPPWAVWFAGAGLAALLLAFGAFQAYDYDLPLHLLTGEHLLRDPSSAGHNVFSFTNPDFEWLNDKWLENVLVHLVDAAAGAPGLVLLRMALVLGLAAVMWRAMEAGPGRDAERDAARWLAPLLVLSFFPFVAYERFTLRPGLFSLLLIAATMWIALRDRRTPAEWIGTGALFAVWVNLHGYWFVGLLVLAALAAGDLVETWMARRREPAGAEAEQSRARLLHRARLLAAALAGALISPHPLRLFWNPFDVLLFVQEDRGALETIIELRSPFHPHTVRNIAIYAFWLAAAALAATLLARIRHVRPGHLFLAGGFLAMACVWRRNIGMFAVVGAVASVWALRSVPPPSRWLPGLRRHAVPLLLLLGALDLVGAWYVATDRFYLRDGTSRRTGLSMSAYTYPQGLADFLLRERPPGPFFNDFASGSYLAYRLYPEYRVFIAGNTFKYPARFFDEYTLVARGGDAYKRAAERYGLNGFAVQYMATDTMPLAQRLFNDAGYVLCYMDDNAVFFARRTPEMETFIAAHRLDPRQLARQRLEAPLPARRRGLLAPAPDARGELNRATFFHRVGVFGLAEVEYGRALEIDPTIPEAREGHAEVILAQGRFQEALDLLNALVADHPRKAHVHHDLAEAHSGLGSTAAAAEDWDAARASLERALQAIERARHLRPDGDPMTALEANDRFNLGYVLWRQAGEAGDPGGALEARADRELEAAMRLQPQDAALLYRVARIRTGQGRGEEALALLERALGNRPALAGDAARDPSFLALRSEPRFQQLLGRGSPGP